MTKTTLFNTFAIEDMSLRDYFAAKAMQGLLVDVNEPAYYLIAEMAYKMADSMIEMRKEQNG